MAHEFRLPAEVCGSVPEGVVVNWFKGEGQSVQVDELLLEVQFEKVVTELNAPVGGTLARILCPQGAVVKAGQPLCVIEERGESREIRASPPARRLAREMGIALESIAGAGPGGRITEDDVRGFAHRHAPPKGPSPATPDTGVTRVPVSPSQRAVADRMLRSFHETAQFTLIREIDAGALAAARGGLRQTGSAVTLTDMIHRSVVLALLDHGYMQAVLEGDHLSIPRDVNLGFAVARREELLVPVIRGAGGLNLEQLAGERRRLTQAVMDGRIRAEELEGGTFTVTNLGTYGIDAFTPVLNPPQPAILGVGRMRRALIPGDDGPRAGHSMALSLTVDHRVINGARAAQFLGKVSDLLSAAGSLVESATGRG